MKSLSLETRKIAGVIQFTSTLICGVLIVFILNAGRDVLIPFALSILFAFLLTPSVNWLQKRGLSNPLAVTAVAIGVLAMLALSAVLIWSSVSDFASNLPKYRGEIVGKVDFANSYVRGLTGQLKGLMKETPEKASDDKSKKPVEGSKGGGNLNKPSDVAPKDSSSNVSAESNSTQSADKDVGDGTAGSSAENPVFVTQTEQGVEFPWQAWAGSAGAIFGPIGNAGLVTVFALFLLINRDDLRERFVAVVSRGNYVVTTEAIAEATQRISRYLVAQLILNASYGIVFGLGLYIIGTVYSPDAGFPSVLFLGAMSGLVRFVPYFGAWVGALLPLTVAIAVFPGYGVFFSVLALVVVLELISNNVAEPWIYGASTGVSSIAIISAAVFWGWLWGVVGLLLATPLTVCLVVLGRYIPRLRFFVTLLSDEKQVKPDQRIYQRLLSGEAHKLEEALEDEAKPRNAIEFVDEVLVPTAKRILRGFQGEDSKDVEFSQKLLDILHNDKLTHLLDPTKKPSDPAIAEVVVPSSERPTCYGVAARHLGETMILSATQRIVKDFLHLQLSDSSHLPEHETVAIVESNPMAVLIVCLPPHGITQTKFWCKSLRSSGYKGDIIVLRPGKFRYYDRMLTSLRKAGATAVTTSVAQTIRRLKTNSAKVLPEPALSSR